MKSTDAVPVTPKKAKRLLGVARVIGPAIAPYAMRAANAARAGYDRLRARRLGIPVDDIGSFTGKGAALHARIAGDRDALAALPVQRRGASDADTAREFIEGAEQRLDELTTAVRASERMPASRRRATHRAVGGELDRIEDGLLRRLGAVG